MALEFFPSMGIFDVSFVSILVLMQKHGVIGVANGALEPDQAGSLFVKYPVLWDFMERSTVPERQKGQLI